MAEIPVFTIRGEQQKEPKQFFTRVFCLRKEPPPQKKYNAAQKISYTLIVVMGLFSLLTGLAIYKPVQFGWLTALLGGFQAARYWHFWIVWIFVAFTITHGILVFVVDPASFRAMLTGRYRGRFPSRD